MLGAAVVSALLVLSTPLMADSTATVDLTPQLQSAGLDIDNLRAVEVGGIVILRGKAVDAAAAQRAGTIAEQLGYTRVANLIQVTPPADDDAIERRTERSLAMNRALEGCRIRIASEQGIVHLAGTVKSELQKDVALDIVRNIDGVRSVRTDFRD